MKFTTRTLQTLVLLSLALVIPLTVSALEKEKKAEEEKVDLKVGDEAPKFEAKDDEGNEWKSEDRVGKKIVVVYFYPADFTGGCTKQACGFRDDMKDLEEEGVEVVGVSGDTPETHALFKKEEELPFTLLADEKGEVCKAFGVPTKDGGSIEREIDGEKKTLTRGVSAARWTFVIDLDGKIIHKETMVKAADDSKAILKLIKEKKE